MSGSAVWAAARVVVMLGVLASLGACASLAKSREAAAEAPARADALARARVWTRTDVPRMDLRRGPSGKGSFRPGVLVDCRYDGRDMSGATPKFTCVRPNGDELKVKFGEDNGEVYAEVAASRLLWGLGFGADRMYPVRVRCRDCPIQSGGPARPGALRVYETAAIERKLPGREISVAGNGGWAWPELDDVDPSRGGASLAERDALKLLAATLQHTDSKPQQQRLICLDAGPESSPCRRPFMLISDLGKTFGKANALNRDGPGSVNLKAWADAPVWAGATGCRANIAASLTGTLDFPTISDAGRRFLADLLQRLTDRQLRDMFAVARFPARAREAGAAADANDWVRAFKSKVAQIADRSCLASGGDS